MANPKVTVAIAGDPRGLNNAFKSAGRSASGFGRTVGRAAGVGLAALGAGAIVAGKHLFETAVDLEAWGEKAEIVFGDSIGMVEDWADANAHAMGLTTAEATNAAAGIADILKPMGFAEDQAADMATELAGLSGALAEWSGGTRTAAEVNDILSAALTGEREALKGLGVVITEADVAARLAAKGQDELTGAAEQQARAIATQELILEKSTDAQRAYAEGGDKLARKQAILGAKVRELRDRLAKVLIPAFASVATWAVDHVVPAIETISTWMADNLPGAIDAFKERWNAFFNSDFVQGALETFRRLRNWVRDELLPKLGDIINRLETAIPNAIDTFKEKWDEFINNETVTQFLGDLEGAWQGFTSWLETTFPEVMGPTREQFVQTEGVISRVSRAIEEMDEEANGFRDDLPGLGHAVDGVYLALEGLHWVLRGLWDIITNQVGPALVLLWQRILAPLAEFIGGTLWHALNGFRIMWDNIVIAVSGVSSAIGWLWDEVLGPIAGFVGSAIWHGLNGFRIMWDNIALAVDAVVGSVQWLIDNIPSIPNPAEFIPDLPIPGFRSSLSTGLSSLVPGGRSTGRNRVAGGGVTVIVQGSVLSERDLAATMRDMVRTGQLDRATLSGLGRG